MSQATFDAIKLQAQGLLNDWLSACTAGKKAPSRNTVAMGIVVLDHLRAPCPLSRNDVISPRGEVSHSHSGLGKVLARYDLPERYLKECTTRQAHQDGQKLFDAFDWGQMLCVLPEGQRDQLLLDLIQQMTALARAWLTRQSMRLDLDRRQSPAAWVGLILEGAHNNQSNGVVEQHLVGAKLERRFPHLDIQNLPAHAGDVQTDRAGDFALENLVYHVTASPGTAVIQKCARNLEAGKHPVLLVPEAQTNKARILAEVDNLKSGITILAIEDFLAMNVIEMASEENRQFFDVLQDMIIIYNRRLVDVETDMSLQIEIH